MVERIYKIILVSLTNLKKGGPVKATIKSFIHELQLLGISDAHFEVIKRKKGLIKEVAEKTAAAIMAATYDLQDGEFLQHVNYGVSIEDTCQRAGFEKVDPDINSTNFPLTKTNHDEVVIKLCPGPAKNFYEFKSEPGYRLATHEEAIAFLSAHFEFSNQKIVCLGSVWYNHPGGVKKVIMFAQISGRSEAFLVPYNCPLREDTSVVLVKL